MSTPAHCPICSGPSVRRLLSLEFSEKQHLPERIDVQLCAVCNFAFSSPRDARAYERYYSSNLNDALGADLSLSASEERRYAGQIDTLQSLLEKEGPLRILDIGCGQAGLLRMLKKRYPNNLYYAADPNLEATQESIRGIQFSRSWKNLDQKFDLIILSHVLEHVVDFAEFCPLPDLLTDGGHVYIEVPDALSYQAYTRQEYLYYFDRLHINHFTLDALRALITRWGLRWGGPGGRREFEYKDGSPYPAIHLLATTPGGAVAEQTPREDPLVDSLLTYLTNESKRSQSIRSLLRQAGPVVVYGFGDNFFRSVGPQGPLSEADITVVIDRRHALLSQSRYGSRYRFMDIETCCAAYPHATYVVTVSWGGAQVRSELQRRGIRNIELI